MNLEINLLPAMLDGGGGEESVVGCDNGHYVDQTPTLNVARGG